MGCFLSTNKPSKPSKFHHHHSSRSSISRAPPPVDVETVKEVLSETPTPNPFTKPESDPRKIRNQTRFLEDPNNTSEIDSAMSECLSTDEIDANYRRKTIDRSPAKSRSRRQFSGELPPARKSPARSKEQSPNRVKPLPERNNRGNGFGSAGRQRPVSGEVPAARSRSPANRTVAGGGEFGGRNEIGRSLSARRSGKSPGRVVSDLNERVRKPDFRSGRVREEGRWPPPNNDESLENPLVSLECFIFL